MRFLNLQLRFLLPLAATLIIAAVVMLGTMDRLAVRWFSRDLGMRGSLLANALSDSIGDSLASGNDARLVQLFERTIKDERLVAIGLCLPNGVVVRRSSAFPDDLRCAQAKEIAARLSPRWEMGGGPVHVGNYPVTTDAGHIADLVLLHDLNFVQRRTSDARNQLLMFVLGLGAAILFITAVVAQVSWRRWAAGVRGILRTGELRHSKAAGKDLEPFVADLKLRMRDLEDEYRRAGNSGNEWTANRLRSLLRTQLSGDEVIVVSNREPYTHERSEAGIVVRRPASGLVTAVEPVMRACSGTWIAHGSGNADKEFVDANDRLMLPPGGEEYALRRIWLSPEEERGYYYGFANEGIWPLCHMAHVRPAFRESDWQHYRAVNQRFADAVIAEARSEDPVVLVQDYHFALLPAMVRERLPRATIITFWHIPWPNPESFGICPWRRELLQGMLGSTILGFQTRYHSNNFIETVDRVLEARIDYEQSSVSYRGDKTLVESYPISIAWPEAQVEGCVSDRSAAREAVENRFGPDLAPRLIVGIDRFDYIKGILERVQALQYLFEHHPEWIGKVSLLQIAAPTREMLDEYRSFREKVVHAVEIINARFGNASYRPVHLVDTHHDHETIHMLYRVADLCMVTSLHDGMNLVSKEFVAARDDENGVLVLSRFTGAARELSEALIVNPYHVEEVAEAMHYGLNMPLAEQRERMISMRMTVQEFNVFRWAGQMLADAARWRLRQRIEARVRRHQTA